MKSREILQLKWDYYLKTNNSLKRHDMRNIIELFLSMFKPNKIKCQSPSLKWYLNENFKIHLV